MTNQANYQPEKLWTPELATVLCVVGVGYFAGAIVTPILSLYMAENNVGGSTIGILSAFMMIGIAISEFFWGWMVDRLDLRVAIFVGTVVLGAMIFGLSFAKPLPVLAFVLFLVGFCRSPNFIVGRWYVGVYAPIRQKALAMAILSTVIGIVDSAGSITSGFLSEARGFKFTFMVAGIGILSAGLLILIFSRKMNFRKHKEVLDLSEYEQPKPTRISRDIKLATAGMGIIGMLYFISFGIFTTYMPLFASNVIGTSTSQVGMLFGIRGLISTAVLIPMGKLIDKKDKWIFLPLCFSAVALSMVGVAYSGSFIWLIASAAVFAFGVSIYSPTVTSILSHSVPVLWTGTAFGILGFLEDTGWMLGPAIGGFLWENMGEKTAFLFAAIATMFAIPFALYHKRNLINAVKVQASLAEESVHYPNQ